MAADVVVIGSGGAALTAAVSAAASGASVAVFERTNLVGGTTAMSGGTLWIPDNRFMAADGVADSKTDAFRYLMAIADRPSLEAHIRRYLEECNPLVAFLERNTKLTFTGSTPTPDYRPWLPGARDRGRSIRQASFDTNRLGQLKSALRRGAGGRDGANVDNVGIGAALIGFLLESCVDRGIELHLEARALGLVRERERVTGVVIEHEGLRDVVEAKLGVILACGGFEWNAALAERFLPTPAITPATHGYNVGDGLRMAMQVGAGLGSMSEAWWTLVVGLPGELYEGHPHHRAANAVRGLPGTIIVNERGRRFTNESMNYHDVCKTMFAFDPVTCEYPNANAHLIFDAGYLAAYDARAFPTSLTSAFGRPRDGSRGEGGDRLIGGGSLHELAAECGIDPHGLEQQVEEFNADAAHGVDRAFHRGENAYDRYLGDASRSGAAMNLRPLGPGPYYALRVRLGTYGTKGGPMTNPDAQVLDLDDRPIPGLYAAGNTAAHVFGSGYPGAGATLGQGLTFGYIAGRAITEGR